VHLPPFSTNEKLTYLLKNREHQRSQCFPKTKYIPLFIDKKQLNSSTKYILMQKANPVVLLFDKKLQHIEITSSMHNY